MFTITLDCESIAHALEELNDWVNDCDIANRKLVHQSIINTEKYCTLIICYTRNTKK